MGRSIDENERNLDDTFSITMELQRPLFEDKIEEQPKKEKSNLKRNILIGLIGVLLVSLVTFFIWISNSYKAMDLAKRALVSDNKIEVNIEEFITFTPKNVNATKGLILYPGAKVEAQAYAPLARGIADKGYKVVIVEMPLNFAMISSNKAQKVIDEYPEITTWAIGGHSLGGVSASKFAAENTKVSGVALLASYPIGDDLRDLGKKVISIWGSKDGVLNFTKLAESKNNLPYDTTYVEIEGGNHAQFGDYGAQKGDHEAIISQQEQLNITYKSILEFMKNLN